MRRASNPTGGQGRCQSALLVWGLALFLLLPAAEPVTAGTYDVVACYGGPDLSWTQFADPGMAAYDECAPHQPGQAISGIIARASVGSGAVGYLQGAYQVFSAPPGASLAGITFTVSPYRWETHWSVGFVAFDGDFNAGSLPWGCYPYRTDCGIFPGSFFQVAPVDLGSRHTQIRIEARCGNPSGCTLASSGRAPYTRATISIANVVVSVHDATQPGVYITGGGLTSGGWLRGVHGLSFDASDNVGIRETRVRADGRQLDSRGKPCDHRLRVPCPQGGDAYSIDTTTVGPDGAHTITAEAVDTAGNVGQANRTILVDNSPPLPPESLMLEGGEGWRSRNDFTLTWRNPPPDGGAPIAGAGYEICPVGGGECQRGSRVGNSLTSIAGAGAPQSGEYLARVWLRDEAGNEDAKTAGRAVRLRFDDEAPELTFEGQDPIDPGRVSVLATDRISGVAGGEIELRRLGAQSWRPLNTRLEASRLIAYPNDETLPDGVYELRARVFDQAGNERSTGHRRDGQRMELTLPVRVKTTLRAGIVKRSARRMDRKKARRNGGRLRERAIVRFGRRARLSGMLADASRNPIPYVDILVFERPRRGGASFDLIARVRTSGKGRFSYSAPKGVSRTLLFRYPGTPTVRPAAREVELLVPASSTIGVSRRFALNGETVTFSGRLRGRPVPAGGKLVELQAYVRRQWRTFATASAGANGRWRYRYRFEGTQGRRTYSFRARVPRESAYPYESGRSGEVKVTVIGV